MLDSELKKISRLHGETLWVVCENFKNLELVKYLWAIFCERKLAHWTELLLLYIDTWIQTNQKGLLQS